MLNYAETARRSTNVSLSPVPPLTSGTQMYVWELNRLSRPTPEQEQELIEQARAGSRHARQRLIESCLSTVEYLASKLCRQITGVEYMDLLEVGNLALVEFFEKVIHLDGPLARLRSQAKYAIGNYCFEYRSLIHTPRQAGLLPKIVVPLDAPVSAHYDLTYADVLAAPRPALEPAGSRLSPRTRSAYGIHAHRERERSAGPLFRSGRLWASKLE